VSLLNRITQAFKREPQNASVPTITLDQVPNDLYPLAEWSYLDGEKFPGGFGPTQFQIVDYWTLRSRSAQLFNENLYARGLIRRLITSIINTGLTLEAEPNARILGMSEDELDEYSENIEDLYSLWADSPELCDYQGRQSFGQLQQTAKMEAMICGDVLCVRRQSSKYNLPMVQIISGNLVQTPFGDPRARDLRIVDGVELDDRGRHVAFWVVQEDGGYERIAATGARTGRKRAWLLYGSDKRHGEVRGQPLLSLILQSLKEIDRYRDSVQRKAVINSMLAVFIKKNEDKQGSRPMTGGAIRRDTAVVNDTDGKTDRFKQLKQQPGMVIETLQHGEEPHGFNSAGIDLSFGPFEDAMIHTIAWTNEIPPEILKLSFNSNYSASQAATNQFKIYQKKERGAFGTQFCQPYYIEWKISECLNGNIDNAEFLNVWRNKNARTIKIYYAWLQSEWTGPIVMSTDLLKQARGYVEMINNALITRSKAVAEMTGMKYSRVVRRLRRENAQMQQAQEPLQVEQSQGNVGEGGEQMTLAKLEESIRIVLEDYHDA